MTRSSDSGRKQPGQGTELIGEEEKGRQGRVLKGSYAFTLESPTFITKLCCRAKREPEAKNFKDLVRVIK